MSQWNPRGNEVFRAALEHEPNQNRRAHLEEACDCDLPLLAHVESLLTAHARTPTMFDRDDPAQTIRPEPLAEQLSSQLGPDRIGFVRKSAHRNGDVRRVSRGR